MKKLIAYITKDIQQEVNDWIHKNIPNTSSQEFDTPFYLLPQDADDPEQEFDEYLVSWRLDPEPLKKLIDYLTKTYPKKFRYSMADRGFESNRVEEDKEEKKKEDPERVIEILEKKEAYLIKEKEDPSVDSALVDQKIEYLEAEKVRIEAFKKKEAVRSLKVK